MEQQDVQVGTGVCSPFFSREMQPRNSMLLKKKRGDKGGLKRKPAGKQGEDLKFKKKKKAIVNHVTKCSAI